MFRKGLAFLLVLCILFSCLPAFAAGGFTFSVADKPEIQANPPKTTQAPLFEEGYAHINSGTKVFATAAMKDELGSFGGQAVVWVSARAARDTQERDVLTIHFAVEGELVTGYLRAARITPLTANEVEGYRQLAADGVVLNSQVRLLPVRFHYAASGEDASQKPFGEGFAVAETVTVQAPAEGKPIPDAPAAPATNNKDELESTFVAVSRSVDGGEWYDLTWSFDGSTLTISGSGDMQRNYQGNYPWHVYRYDTTAIVIEAGVKTIAVGAFMSYTNLTSLTIGPDVWLINADAFSNCTALKTLTIPAYVQHISGDAFWSCCELSQIIFAENSQLGYIGIGAFEFCTALGTLALPDSVTELGERAFNQNTHLTSLDFGNGIEKIGKQCFSRCTGLTTVDFPASLRSIGAYAFNECDNLTTITVAEGLESLGESAFSHCEKLTGSITIPATVTEWGANTFQKCAITEANIYSNCEIGYGAFQDNKSLAKLTIGDTVTGVGDQAFYNNTALTQVNIPASAVNIGYNAFANCTALSHLTIAEGVEVIVNSAFYNTAITELELPDSIRSLGAKAFAYCTQLETLKLGNGITAIPDYGFYDCTSLSHIVWPSGLVSVGEWAFFDCESIVELALPATLEEIGFCAFGSCGALQSVSTGEALALVESSAFDYCYALFAFTTYSTTASFDDEAFLRGNLTIYGFPGSTAETYANLNGHDFQPITVLDKPVCHKITNTVQGVHVYWQRVPAAATYTLWRSATKTGGYTKVVENLTALHYTDTKVTSGKTYYYKVVAHNGEAKSPASEAISNIYVSTPDITSRFNKAAGVVLGWNKVTGATGYAVYRKSYAGSDAWARVATITSGSTLTWTDTSVKNNNGTVYRYTVRALAGSNRNILSGCRTGGRTMVRLCSQTLKSATKASATSIKASWSTSAAVTGYEVRFMTGSTVYKTVTIGNYKTGVKTFTGLPGGKTYKVQVRTYKKVDGVGSFYSAWSTEKYVTLP